MKLLKKSLVLFALFAMTLVLFTNCRDTAEKAEDDMEQMGEDMEDAAEDVGEDMEDAAEDVEEEVEETTDDN